MGSFVFQAGTSLRLILLAGLLALGAALPTRSALGTERNPTPASAGTLIYSVSTLDIAMNFTFRYRRVRTASGEDVTDQRGVIECRCVGLTRARISNADYSGQETGRVFVRQLPPGDYEVYDFGFGGNIGNTIVSSSSARRFVIPFTVRTGEATYIGNFARAPSLGTPLQRQLGAGGLFIVSDKSERDIAIARRRDSSLPPVTVLVTDVSAFRHPMLYASDPR